MNKAEFLEKMVGRGRISQADVDAITETKTDNDELVSDFLAVYDKFKSGTLETNASIGAEIKKVFARQENRNTRKAARIASKAARIAARVKK